MLLSEQKPMEEILASLDGEKSVFLMGCRGCAEACQTGGDKQVYEMKQRLEEAGKAVSGYSIIDTVCNDFLVKMRLMGHKDELDSADSVLVLACGVAVQSTSAVVDKVVHPGCNTISLGGRHGEWKENWHCLECGNCVLDYTGGICPIARCAKSLLNGPCGGSVAGKCEVNNRLPCAWQQIIDRLTQLGRLDKLEKIVPLKDWSVSLTGGQPTVQ